MNQLSLDLARSILGNLLRARSSHCLPRFPPTRPIGGWAAMI